MALQEGPEQIRRLSTHDEARLLRRIAAVSDYNKSDLRRCAHGEEEVHGSSTGPGTSNHFLPDRTIFKPEAKLDRTRLPEELHGLAALAPSFAFELVTSARRTPSLGSTVVHAASHDQQNIAAPEVHDAVRKV